MGYSSQSGQVLLRTQASQGVLATDLATAGVAVKLRGGALGPNRELLTTDPEIGGGRDISDAYLGAVSWSGDYEFYARLEMITTLLRSALGSATSAPTAVGATSHVHTITASDASALPYLSIEEAISSGLEVFNYTDAVVNTFHLECDANGYLQGTAGLIGARQVAGATRTASPVYDNSPLIVGTNVRLTYDGVTLPAKSFSIDINNNFEDDDYRLGSFFIGDLTPMQREVTASFGVRTDGAALWRQATYGLSTATTPGGLTQKKPLTITADTYEDIAGAVGIKGRLELTFPKFALSPFAYEASGSDILENDIEGQAFRPDPATAVMSCKVTNGKAAIA